MVKQFDCIQMKRDGADAVYERVHTMSREEELAYWQQLTEELLQIQEQARTAAIDKPSG